MSDSCDLTGCPAIRVVMMPRDTNPHGTIFGGVLLSYIDQAGAIAARSLAPHPFVTIAMDAVEFRHPVFVGDVLSFYARIEKVGRTSVRIRVVVQAERYKQPAVKVNVTEAVVTYVAVDENIQKVVIAAPPGAGSPA